jgi:alpha-glucosidase
MLTTTQLEASNSMLSVVPQGLYKDTNALANVTVLGVSRQPGSVSFNGTKLSSGWSYDSSSKVLAVTQLNSATGGGAWAAPWSLSWS